MSFRFSLLICVPECAEQTLYTFDRGQQQRISLARAVYARSDLVLLDDILSAIDSFVYLILCTSISAYKSYIE